jgi:hypothetical protein
MLKKATTSILVIVPMAIAIAQGESQAQLLTAERCQNAYNVTAGQAQGRYAWATFCRVNPATNPNNGTLYTAEKYLTAASVNDYNARPDLQPWLFPTYFDFVSFAPWDVPFNAGTNCALIPTAASNVGLCVAGCYTADQKLTFSEGDIEIKQALEAGEIKLVTLTPDATIDQLDYMTNTVHSYTVDKYEDWQDIYVFTMESGGVLKVTNTHPLITDDGMMRQAQDLIPGDALVRANGSADAIVDVTVEKYFGKVYNVSPTTVDHTSNIVVAQGYLNGSHRYQNEFLDVVNSVILRRALVQFPE